MYLKISIYKMPISVAFSRLAVRTGHHWQQNCLLNCKLDFLQHFWRDKLASTFLSLCEEKLRLDDNSPRFRTEPGNRTTFLQWYPLIWFKKEELQDTRGRGVGSSPPSPHHPWGDLIMKGLWDWALLRTCYVIQLPLSCFGCRFAASRNSCFEITSVVSHFSSPTPPLPLLYNPPVKPDVQFIQTHNLTPCRR